MEKEIMLNEHSEEINDIITTIPSRIVRSGTLLIFLTLTSIILLSAFIRYPDIVQTELKVISANLPKVVSAKIDAKVVKLLVSNDSYVTKGTTVAYLESTAKHEDILRLDSNIVVMKNKKNNPSALDLNSVSMDLGELQEFFAQYHQAYITYFLAQSQSGNSKKRNLLENDLKVLEKQMKHVLSQKNILKRNNELALEDLKMHRVLTQKKVEAPMELKRQESLYLEKIASSRSSDSQIYELEKNKNAKNTELLDLENSFIEAKLRYQQALNNLISQISLWKSRYLLTAPVTGTVVYANGLQENSEIKIGDAVVYINTGNKEFTGQIKLSQVKMGKISGGQRVLIKLRGFPFEEYGILEGRLQNLSEIPLNDSVFVAKVPITPTALRNLKKKITLKVGMSGEAEVITQDASLLTRLFYSIMKYKQL